MIKKRLNTVIIILLFLLFKHYLIFGAQTSKDNYTGSWSTATSWSPTWATPQTSAISQDINIFGYITTLGDISFGGAGGNLIINDTLIINGNLTLGNNNNITVNDGGMLIVRGNVSIANNVDIAANAYIVITGNFTKSGAINQGTFTSNDTPSNVFIGGTITVPENKGVTWASEPGSVLNCTGTNDYDNSECNYGNVIDLVESPIGPFIQSGCTPVPNITSITSNSPIQAGNSLNLQANGDVGTGGTWPLTYIWTGPLSYGATGASVSRSSTTTGMTGYYVLSLMNADGCFAKDSVYADITSTNCCSGFSYASKDNYAGSWADVNSWATPDEAWRPLPPPTDPMNSQPICINGYITLQGNLTINGGNQKICDTLVITGNLDLNSYSFTVEPTGVLIVLGNFTGNSGSLTNAGRVVVVSDITNPSSSSITNTGSFYVFDDTPDIQGFIPTGDETILATNDPSLSNLINSILCGSFSGGTISSAQTICAGDDVVAFTNEAFPSPGSGFTYQWYSSENSSNPSSGTWTSISGATSEIYDHGAITQITYFYRKATKSGVCTANSNVLAITVNLSPTVTVNATSDTICFGDNTVLNATGGVSYEWNSIDNLGNSHNSELSSLTAQNPTYTPATNPQSSTPLTITFTVTVTGSNNCINTGNMSVVLIRTPVTSPQYHIKNDF